MMTTMMGNFATTVLLLAFLCVDLACGLVLSGPPLVSSSSPFVTTYSADSTLYRSYSSPSSLEHGIATWLAARQPNQSIRPFVPTSVPNAQTDTSQDAVPDWKEQWGSFAGVATVVSAFATSIATVGGGVMALQMDKREKGRDERETGRDEREERWRVEDRKSQRQRDQLSLKPSSKAYQRLEEQIEKDQSDLFLLRKQALRIEEEKCKDEKERKRIKKKIDSLKSERLDELVIQGARLNTHGSINGTDVVLKQFRKELDGVAVDNSLWCSPEYEQEFQLQLVSGIDELRRISWRRRMLAWLQQRAEKVLHWARYRESTTSASSRRESMSSSSSSHDGGSNHHHPKTLNPHATSKTAATSSSSSLSPNDSFGIDDDHRSLEPALETEQAVPPRCLTEQLSD